MHNVSPPTRLGFVLPWGMCVGQTNVADATVTALFCVDHLRVPPSARVRESWRLAGAIESGRWGRPLGRWLGNAHGCAFISAGAWGVVGSSGGVSSGCPLVVEIARQEDLVDFWVVLMSVRIGWAVWEGWFLLAFRADVVKG